MPRLAANLTFMFDECELADRFAAAARAGFKGIEYQYPYGEDIHAWKHALEAHALTMVLINLPAGNQHAGERGIACHPDRIAEFEDGVDQAIEHAQVLGCGQVNCLAGIRPSGVDPIDARETFIKNLQFAAIRLKAAGIKLLIEPINTRDIPGFFLNNSAQAIDIITAVGSDNLFLQYDVYHMQIMEGDLAPTLKKYLKKIGHIQLADTPGRHEPGTGEINYDFLLSYIDNIGYEGWISCEYRPLGKTIDGLGWARRHLAPTADSKD